MSIRDLTDAQFYELLKDIFPTEQEQENDDDSDSE